MEPTPLTAADVAALRKADTISFHLYHDRIGGLVSKIAATKERRRTEADPFAEDVTVNVYVGHSVRDYGDRKATRYTAFDMIHHPQGCDWWRTIVSLLKTGDILTLVWIRDNNTQVVKEAGLHYDSLQLRVDRGSKSMTFKVATSVCPDNTARMVRAESYSLV